MNIDMNEAGLLVELLNIYDKHLREDDITSFGKLYDKLYKFSQGQEMGNFEKMNQKFFDKLDRIFTLQKELDDRIIRQIASPIPELLTQEKRVSELCTAIVHEACELQRLTSWKWWKKPTEFNEQEARKELVDIIHFVVSAAIVLGMTPADILEEYEKKNRINHQRQEQGY